MLRGFLIPPYYRKLKFDYDKLMSWNTLFVTWMNRKVSHRR